MRFWFALSFAMIWTHAISPSNVRAQTGPEWKQFGDWEVAAVHDEMSPVSQVIIRTTVVPDDSESRSEPFNYGFRVFGRELITQDVAYGMSGRNFWPHCDYDFSTFKVDDGKPSYIATIEDGGSCENVSIQVIRKFQSGSSAKLKINYVTGTISLKGFSAAWRRLQQLSFE